MFMGLYSVWMLPYTLWPSSLVARMTSMALIRWRLSEAAAQMAAEITCRRMLS